MNFVGDSLNRTNDARWNFQRLRSEDIAGQWALAMDLVDQKPGSVVMAAAADNTHPLLAHSHVKHQPVD